MFARITAFCLGLFLVSPVSAQEDPMELQRCIWRCLAGSPGAASAQYRQCVNQYCTAPISPLGSVAPSDWSSGIASDGIHRFAITPAEQGYAFTYFCTATDSFFTLNIDELQAGQYRLLIGQIDFVVPFNMSRGVLSVIIPPQSQFMQAVRRGGKWMTLRAMDGTYLLRFSLIGADRHIGNAVSGCAGGSGG